MAIRALVSADRPVVRIWHPDDPKVYVEIHIGRRVDQQPTDEAEHFIRCPGCGGGIDCGDLGQVFEHEGPLPHPAQDQPTSGGSRSGRGGGA
jgi:hypothetical protein